ncbi:hypothetical protein K1719_017799 [Acacia pycnantha]|nr:hypothetical protein K1719_017799 [Acacia pycnantha]
MDQSEFPAPQSCCIYRVPPELREVNEAAYTPVMVSIGPFHRGNKRLNSMEEVKLWFLYKFLKRTQDRSFDDYVCVLGNQEIKIRHEDRWHPKLWSMQDIDRDLILLENQLPFFVLKDLFDPTFPNGYNDGRLPIEFVTYYYFYHAFTHNIVANQKLREKLTFPYFAQHHLLRLLDGTPQVHHLCDMLRICYVRLDQLSREHNPRKLKHVYSECKLHAAGIKFVVNEDEISLLKLQYSKGVLKIPKFMISDSTETHLRNVVAFEQCQFPSSRSMTDYMVFWEHFIRTEKDVEILEEKGVIQNLVGGNDAMASIIKILGRHTGYINFDNEMLYWSTPWRIASVLGAIVLLVLTLIQTISSVIDFLQN